MVFVVAFIVVYRTRPRISTGTGLSLGSGGAIKDLLSFGYQDAEIFERLGRPLNLKRQRTPAPIHTKRERAENPP